MLEMINEIIFSKGFFIFSFVFWVAVFAHVYYIHIRSKHMDEM